MSFNRPVDKMDLLLKASSDKNQQYDQNYSGHGDYRSGETRIVLENNDDDREETCDDDDTVIENDTAYVVNDNDSTNEGLTSNDVIYRIEKVVHNILITLEQKEIPIIEPYQRHCIKIDSATSGISNNTLKAVSTKRFTINQCRSFTSVVLVASFCHSLILQKRTTTTREVYYYYVTHFKCQRECDNAIWDLCYLLNVPRHLLHIIASPRGWFCGDIQLLPKKATSSDTRRNNKRRVNDEQEEEEHDDDYDEKGCKVKVLLDGRSIPSVHGAPISSEWLLPYQQRNFSIQTVAATCILVIEKEGVYNRLSEDQFYKKYPCIIITGKGFPDYATRAMVATLHKELKIPVRGLSDCNPFGVLILNTYHHSNRSVGVRNSLQSRRGHYTNRACNNGIDNENDDIGDPYGVPVDWIGLRPSQISHIMNLSASKRKSNVGQDITASTSTYDPITPETVFPPEVFQKLTPTDKQRLFGTLLNEDHEHPWLTYGHRKERLEELHDMQHYKVELEALNWLGMGFICTWLGAIFDCNQNTILNSPVSEHHEDIDHEKQWMHFI